MHRLFNSSMVVLLFLIACSDLSEKPCEGHFLDQINGSNVYYYENGLLAQFSDVNGVITLEYNEDGKASRLVRYNTVILYYYDEDNRIDYIIQQIESLKDSIQTTYDDQNRIIKLMLYEQNSPLTYSLKQTCEYEYSGNNTTKSRFYTPDGYDITTEVLIDNNPRPLPQEAWVSDFMYNLPLFFVEHNVTKITGTIPSGEQNVFNYEFTYDPDGYPVSVTLNGSSTEYAYSCKQRIAE